MRKVALFVALAMIAASPAMAAQKKSKRAAEPAMTPEAQAWDNSYRLVRDGLPMWLPSWAQLIYQTGVKPNMQAEQPKPAKKRSKKQS